MHFSNIALIITGEGAIWKNKDIPEPSPLFLESVVFSLDLFCPVFICADLGRDSFGRWGAPAYA
jgi:hypothetical protein